MPFCRWVPMTVKTPKPKNYSDTPQTLGQHLKKRRKELGLFQREVAAQMGIGTETYANWEKGNTKPVAAQFRPIVAFLGYDPSPTPKTLAERLQAKRRALRVARGLSQEALAVDAEIERSYMSRIERGLENPSVAVLERIAKALRAEITELFANGTASKGLLPTLRPGRKPSGKR